MQIQGSKRGDKRSTWLISRGVEGRYCGCIIRTWLEEVGKREWCVLGRDGEIETKGLQGTVSLLDTCFIILHNWHLNFNVKEIVCFYMNIQ